MLQSIRTATASYFNNLNILMSKEKDSPQIIHRSKIIESKMSSPRLQSQSQSNYLDQLQSKRTLSPLKVCRKRPPTPISKPNLPVLLPFCEEESNNYPTDAMESSDSSYISRSSSPQTTPESSDLQDQPIQDKYDTPMTAYGVLRILNGRAHLGVEIPKCNY